MRLFLLIFFSSMIAYGQNRKIDSLQNELRKNPRNFYTHVATITELQRTKNIAALKVEIEKGKKNFQTDNDYYNYFKINYAAIPLIQGKQKETEKLLQSYSESINLDNAPHSQIALNYLKGCLANNLGNHQSAKLYFENCLRITDNLDEDKNKFAHISNTYATSLISLGEYEKALQVLFEISKIKEYKNSGHVFTNIGICYFSLNQFEKAEIYYKKSITNSEPHSIANNTSNLAILYIEMKKIAEAEGVMRTIDFAKLSTMDSAAVFSVLAEISNERQKHNQAITYFKIVEKIDRRLGRNSYLINDYSAIANSYIRIKSYNAAKTYLSKALLLLEKYQDENAKMEILEMLIEIDFAENNNHETQRYFDEYRSISDSIRSKAVLENTNALDKEYQTAEKEAKIAQQQLQLQKEKTSRNLAIATVGLLFTLSGGGFWLYRKQQKNTELKNKNTLLQLQQHLSEMELDNLNKQLDPHEIKNLLASIAPEIQEKAPESYLRMVKLFNLTKASLNNNSITDVLKNQLQQIDDFLSLEKTMMTEQLEYTIESPITTAQMQIPRLMLKNLVENSVKHGIKGKGISATISVRISEDDDSVFIIIDDTGIGRKNGNNFGIGISTYQKLFEVLNEKNEQLASFEIIDKDQGTRVEIKIPKNYEYW